MDVEKEDVVEAFYKAQEMLIIMDSKRPPSDKLTCVVEASKAVFEILDKSSGGTKIAAADDFLPVLIYVVLQVRPMHCTPLESMALVLDGVCVGGACVAVRCRSPPTPQPFGASSLHPCHSRPYPPLPTRTRSTPT
jgi:hypothetical protein